MGQTSLWQTSEGRGPLCLTFFTHSKLVLLDFVVTIGVHISLYRSVPQICLPYKTWGGLIREMRQFISRLPPSGKARPHCRWGVEPSTRQPREMLPTLAVG